MLAPPSCWILLAVVAGSCACGSLRSSPSSEPPATTDATDASADPWPAEAGGPGSASAPDGGLDAGPSNPGDAGTTAGEDAGVEMGVPLRWDVLSTPPDEAAFLGASGRAPDDVYLVSNNRGLFHFDGAAVSLVWRASVLLKAVHVTADGQVFVGAYDDEVYRCVTSCTGPERFIAEKAFFGSNGAYQATALCGSSDGRRVYAAGMEGTGAALSAWDAESGWRSLSVPDVTPLQGCWVSPSGELFAATTEHVLRYGGAGVTLEAIDYPVEWSRSQVSNHTWFGVWGVAGRIFAHGSHGFVAERVDGRFIPFVPPGDLAPLVRGLGTVQPGGPLLVFGDLEQNPGLIELSQGAARIRWAPPPTALPGFRARSALSFPEARVVIVPGTLGATGKGLVYRARPR